MPSEDLKEFAATVHNEPIKVSQDAPSSSSRIFGIDYAVDILTGLKKPNLFLLAFLSCIFSVITLSILLLGTVYPFVQKLESKVSKLVTDIYPKDLEINIKNGTVSTNVTEPYYLTIDKRKLEDFISLIGKNNDHSISKLRLLTIDTQGKAEDFERYQTMALLTQRNLVYYNDNEVKITSLSSISDVKITQQMLLSKVREINKGGKVIRFISILIIISPILLLLGGVAFAFIAFLFIGFVAHYFVIKTYCPDATFSRTYRFTAFVVTVLGLLEGLISLIPSKILVTQPIQSLTLFGVIIWAYVAAKRAVTRTQPSSVV